MHQFQLPVSERCRVSAAGRPESAWLHRAKAQCCGVQAAEVRWARWAGPLQCLMDVWQARGLGRGLSWKRGLIKGGNWDVGLPSGRLSWLNDKNLLQRKGRAWLKGLTAFTLTGWLISHYSSRMWLSEGNSGKCLILSNIDYLKTSFLHKSKHFFFTIFVLNWHSRSFLIPRWSLFRISALSGLLHSKPGANTLGTSEGLTYSAHVVPFDIRWHVGLRPVSGEAMTVIAAQFGSRDLYHQITIWLLPTWGTLLWISLKKWGFTLDDIYLVWLQFSCLASQALFRKLCVLVTVIYSSWAWDKKEKMEQCFHPSPHRITYSNGYAESDEKSF